MEPAALASVVAKPAVTRLLKYLGQRMARNDEQLRRDREELSLEWGAELKAALPQVVAYFDARIDNLDDRLAKVFEDPQFGRIFTNFTFEAFREAIDDRRSMLAHAAIGIIDPDISVERKARVERTLRALDPIDVLTLRGLELVPGSVDAAGPRAELLRGRPSGDVLLSAGCIRLQVLGGGLSVGAFAGIEITQLGKDVLMVLRTFLATRPPPFEVPGRERRPEERTEAQARAIIERLPGLLDFALWTTRRSSQVDRLYHRIQKSEPRSAVLRFFIHDWKGWLSKLEELVAICATAEINMTLTAQPHTPSGGAPYDLLRAELHGRHDLLRYIADDSEALWTDT